MVITPHYTGTDPQGLADALKANIIANTTLAGGPSFTINIYLATGPPPHHPIATATRAGITPTSTLPREVAACLSYYATLNQPRLRGRVYLPAPIMGMGVGARIAGADVTRVLGWGATLFKTLNSGSVAVVYSRKSGTTAPITNYWADNEWDTVRSRGLVATTRSLGTVP